MPKTIKKKIEKTSGPQETVQHTFEDLKAMMHKKQRIIMLTAIAAAVIIILALGVYLFMKSRIEQAKTLEYEAYRIYNNLYAAKPRGLNETEDALSRFKSAYKLRPKAATLLYIAGCYNDLGKKKEAVDTLMELNRKFSDDKNVLPMSYLRLYYLYMQMGNKEEAKKIIATLYSLDSPYFKDIALFLSAESLSSAGSIKDALMKYEELVKKYPDSPYVGDAMTRINSLKASAGGGVVIGPGFGATGVGGAQGLLNPPAAPDAKK